MPAKEAFKISVSDEDAPEAALSAEAKETAAAPAKTPAKRKAAAAKAVKKAPVKAAKKKPAASSETAPAVKKAPVPKKKVAVVDEDQAGPIDRMLEAEAEPKKPEPRLDDFLAQRQSAVKAVIAGIQPEKAAQTEPKAEPKPGLMADVRAQAKAAPSAAAAAAVPAAPAAPAEPVRALHRPIKLYRNIALSFIAFTVVVLAVIFYFVFAKVTITLVPNQERLTNNLIFDIIDTEKSDSASVNAVKGVVRDLKITASETYAATGKEVIGQEAVGRVTLYNNYNKSQPLVATTRLLSADGRLFRLKDTVNVPAGGQAEAEIYADEPTPESAVGPTKFTIPGLWAGLQDKIYAENKEPVVYQEKAKLRVVQEDIDNATRDIKQKLLAKAKEEVSASYGADREAIFKIDDGSLAVDIKAKPGDEAESFEAAMAADVAVVAFDKAAAVELQRARFLESLGDSKELVSFNADQTIYALNTFDTETGEAAVNATFEGQVSLKENAKVVEVDKILGLNDEQLNTYLSGLPEIAGFEVAYFPAFIKRVPRLTDRVEIVIKK